MFKYFPNVSLDLVLTKDFWDDAGRRLFVLQAREDLSVGKFYPLFAVIIKYVESIGSIRGVLSPF